MIQIVFATVLPTLFIYKHLRGNFHEGVLIYSELGSFLVNYPYGELVLVIGTEALGLARRMIGSPFIRH